jgi:hypothetical protein
MLALLVLDKLNECSSFPMDDVSVELISTIEEYGMINAEYKAKYYMDLIPKLDRIGRIDLVSGIQEALAAWTERSSCV